VLWRLLGTSPHVSALPAEGQYIESVKSILRQDPWNDQVQIPWDTIKSRWKLEWNLEKPILIEKSPPHIIRAFELEKYFSPAFFVIIIRNPYAFCEGYTRRRKGKSMAEAANFWVRCAEFQKKNIAGLNKSIFFTYESLTDNLQETTEQLIQFLPDLERLQPGESFPSMSIINYQARPIQNFNQIKIDILSTKDILEINEVLEGNIEYLDYFGYEIIHPAKFHQLQRIKAMGTLRITRLFNRGKGVMKRLIEYFHH